MKKVTPGSGFSESFGPEDRIFRPKRYLYVDEIMEGIFNEVTVEIENKFDRMIEKEMIEELLSFIFVVQVESAMLDQRDIQIPSFGRFLIKKDRKKLESFRKDSIFVAKVQTSKPRIAGKWVSLTTRKKGNKNGQGHDDGNDLDLVNKEQTH